MLTYEHLLPSQVEQLPEDAFFKELDDKAHEAFGDDEVNRKVFSKAMRKIYENKILSQRSAQQ